MFKNYLKSSIRNLRRYKAYSSINIIGLALGIACTILIFLWIEYEFSFDKFHQKGDHIYRLLIEENGTTDSTTPPLLGKILVDEYPEVVNASRFFALSGDKTLIEYDAKKVEETYTFADPHIFEMFSFRLIKGNPKTALINPRSIVISEKLADKLFTNADPIGKIINQRQKAFIVTGVIENIPRNSSIQFDFLLSLNLFKELGRTYDWNARTFHTYIHLSENCSISDVSEKINLCYQRYVPDRKQIVRSQPLFDIHLYSSSLQNDGINTGNILYIYILASIAVLVLFVACINYINLTTSLYLNRTKEVGLRKVVGAKRQQLLIQFLTESVLMALIASLLAILLVDITLPQMNSLFWMTLKPNYSNFRFISGFFIILCVTGIVSGSYPAFFLSKSNPTKIFKNVNDGMTRSLSFRKLLVIFQNIITVALIFSVTIISYQFHYIKNKNLGYDRENSHLEQ